MADVELIDGEGWKLIKTSKEDQEDLKTCFNCGIDLYLPYYYCKEFNKGICNECERGNTNRLCHSREPEHEHFNIIM